MISCRGSAGCRCDVPSLLKSGFLHHLLRCQHQAALVEDELLHLAILTALELQLYADRLAEETIGLPLDRKIDELRLFTQLAEEIASAGIDLDDEFRQAQLVAACEFAELLARGFSFLRF